MYVLLCGIPKYGMLHTNKVIIMSTKTVNNKIFNTNNTYETKNQKKRIATIFGAITGTIAVIISTVVLILSQVDISFSLY